MSAFINIVPLGASSASNPANVPTWEPALEAGGETQGFGPTQVFQALGVSSLPWSKDKSGYAEALVCSFGGRSVCLGARDTRSAKIVGNLKPGDTVLHSTGPNQAAQCQLKEASGLAALVTKTLRNGKSMALMLDGKNEKVQLTHAGAVLEIDDNGDISLLNSSGCGFLIQGKKVFVVGDLQPGKGNPPGFAFALCPPTGSPGGPASVPLIPCKGITPG